MSNKYFPAKILLFGEYTVTLGSPALAIPFFGKSGHWDTSIQKNESDLLAFANFLYENNFEDVLRVTTFLEDLKNDLFFSSDIPAGYGMGSSGALVAAVYDRYAIQKVSDPNELKQIFARLESFFHGKSSGIDPLVSYLKEPILWDGEKGVRVVKLPAYLDFQIFLVDSFQSRNTEQWVSRFMQKKTENTEFTASIHDLSLHNHAAIEALLEGEIDIFWLQLKKISRLQFLHFHEFIPSNHHNVWENSLLNELMSLKLCGAGGGGYTLGFLKNKTYHPREVSPFSPVWVS